MFIKIPFTNYTYIKILLVHDLYYIIQAPELNQIKFIITYQISLSFDVFQQNYISALQKMN